MAHRKEKIQEFLHHEVALILERDFRMPGTLLTVMGMKLSFDGQHAIVYYSVLPQSKQEETAKMLERNIYDIQQVINHKARFRPVPKLRFLLDTSQIEATRIEELLRKEEDELNKKPKKQNGASQRGRVRKTA
jgi:ribosome-binding factor A